MNIKKILQIIPVVVALSVLTAAPESKEYFNMGVVNYIRGDLQEASRNFEEAYSRHPADEQVKTFYLKTLVELGTQFYENRDYERAEPFLEKARRLAPNDRLVQRMYSIATGPEKESTPITPALEGFRREQEKVISAYLQRGDVVEEVLNRFEEERRLLEERLDRTVRTNTYNIVGLILGAGILFVGIIILARKKEKERLTSLIKHEEKVIKELRESSRGGGAYRPQLKESKRKSEINNILTRAEKRILVIEDSPHERKWLANFLESQDYEVDQAENGVEAIRCIEEKEYNIVITDLRMEKIDGIEVLKKVHEIQPDIEVIVVTAFSSAESAVDAMKNGAYDYILKPLNMDKLEIVIKRCLEKQKLTGRVSGLQLELLEKELVGESDPEVARRLLEPFFKDRSAWIRANAARIISNFDEKKALNILKEMLQSGERRARQAATWAVKEIDTPRALKLINSASHKEKIAEFYEADFKLLFKESRPRDVVTDINPAIRKRSKEIESLDKELTGSESGEDVMTMLEGYLKDKNNRIRANAVKVLYKYDENAALKYLEKMLASSSVWMKISALWVCSEVRTDKTVKLLEKYLNNPNKLVSEKAEQFLDEISEE